MKELNSKMNDMMQTLIATAVDVEKFEQGNKSAGVRARKGLREVKKIASGLVKVSLTTDKDI